MKMKKYKKAAMGMAATGIGLGVMGSMPGAGPVVGKMSKALPIAGGIMGAGMVMDAVKGLEKSTKLESYSPKKKKKDMPY